MKVRLRIVLSWGVCACVVTLAAARAEELNYFEQFREELQKNKVAVVGDAMQLTPDQAGKFWPVFAEYEKERGKVVERRIALLKEYVEGLDTMTNRKADELLGRSFAVRRDLLALQERYAAKMKTAISPIVAARFAQVEQQIQLVRELQVAAELPLIEVGALVDPDKLDDSTAPEAAEQEAGKQKAGEQESGDHSPTGQNSAPNQ